MKQILSLRAEGVLPGAEGRSSSGSPLEGLGMLFPNGTPTREITATRDQPAGTMQRSSGVTLQHFLSGFDLVTGPGIVSRTEAWRSPHVRRCVEATCEQIAGLPFVIYDGEDRLRKHWWLDFVEHPNEYLQMSEHDLKEQTVAIRMLFGECFWFLDREDAPTRSGKKAPIGAIWTYHPHAVTEAIDGRTRRQVGWIVQFEAERFFVDIEDMVHFRRYDPMRHNPVRPSRGTSPLDAALLAVSTDTAASKFNLDFFSRGFAPGVILLTKDNVQVAAGTEQQLADKLRAGHAGKNNGIAILDGSMVDVVQVSTSQKDAEFSNAKKIAMSEVLEAFGVPPCVAGNQDQKYDNAEMQLLVWWDGPLNSIISNLRSAINNGPLKKEPTITCDLDTSRVAVLRKRRLESVDKYVNLIGNARHTPIEAGRITGIDVDPKMPGANVALVSFAQIPFELAAEGASVSISKDETPETPLIVPDPAAVADDQKPPTPTVPERAIRVLVADTPAEQKIVRVAPILTRAKNDDLFSLILKITAKDAKKIRDKAAPFQAQAVQIGLEQIGDSIGSKKILAIDDPRVIAFLEERGNLITSVPDGVATRIWKKSTSLIEQGTSPEDIGTILRKDFNDLTSYEARTIGRNEVGSGLNGGRFMQMEEEGVESREWLSSRDARVRDTPTASHVEMDGEVVGIADTYSNGLRFPQDPEGDADEVINCRCLELPAAKGTRAARCRMHMRALATREIAFAAQKNEQIDERTGYWRAIALAKPVRETERRMADAMKAIINGWRAPIFKALADAGVVK